MRRSAASRLVLVLLAVRLAAAATPVRAQPLAPGAPLPDLTLTTLEGDTLRLAALHGRVVLVDFWATWCGPCLPELPHLRAVRARHPEADLAIVSVALERNRDRLETYVLRERLAWTHVPAPDAFEARAAEAFGVVGIPAAFLFGRDGRLVARGLRGTALEAAVDALVSDAD